jgi:hypothetical protein
LLHVTNGDSTVPGIEATGVGGEVLPWRDALHEGPLAPGVGADELRAVRARFLADCGWGDADAIEAGMRARDERLQAALGRDEVVVLWFEHDLYDQLQLIQVLDAVDGNGAMVEAILSDRFLGAMDARELAALWPDRAPLRPDQVALGRLAWEAVRAPDPHGIEALLNTHTAALPHLGPALRRLRSATASAAPSARRSRRSRRGRGPRFRSSSPHRRPRRRRSSATRGCGGAWLSSAPARTGSCGPPTERRSARRRRARTPTAPRRTSSS